ncbi:MAG: NTP transferase domain-containing protein [Kofleriaceae bacterium]
MGTISNALILCGGRGSRWERAVPKQLTVIDGEPLLTRTTRLLREAGAEAVTLIAQDDRITAPGATRCADPSRWIAEAVWATRRLWGARPVVLCGDVYFSEPVLAALAHHPGRTTYVGRWGGVPGTVLRPGYIPHNIYGLQIGAGDLAFARAVRSAVDDAIRDDPTEHSGFHGSLWSTFVRQFGTHPADRPPPVGFTSIPLDDETSDIDSVEELGAFLQARGSQP